MKVLFAGAYLPYPLISGGRIRSYHLLRELSRRHEVHLLALSHDSSPNAGSLRDLCATVDTVPAPARLPGGTGRVWRLWARPDDIVLTRTCGLLEAKLRARLGEEHFDLLFLDDLGAECYLRLRDRPRTLLSKHNAEGRLLDRLAALKQGRPAAGTLARWEAHITRQREARAIALADGTLVPTDADRAELAGLVTGRPIFVVPNGADTGHFCPQPNPQSATPTLLFCGALFWYPNADGILWFCRDILPLVRRQVPGVRLRIVGEGAPSAVRSLASLPGVDLLGFVDDARPYLAAATACVVPLRVGAGSRLKILEALAAGRAVITTSVGAEGLDLTPGRDLCVADGAEAFAHETVGLLTDPIRRFALEQSGRATVVARHDWRQALSGLDRICTDARHNAPDCAAKRRAGL